MTIKNTVMGAAAAISLVSAPAMAQAVSAERSAEAADKTSKLEGESIVPAILAAAIVIGGIILIATDDDDAPTSP